MVTQKGKGIQCSEARNRLFVWRCNDNAKYCNMVDSLMNIFGICSWLDQIKRRDDESDGIELLEDVWRNSRVN